MNHTERSIQRAHLRFGNRHCARCGKVVFDSESEARNALQMLVALRMEEYDQLAEAEVYDCHPKYRPQGRVVYHLTSHKHGEVNEALRDKRAVKIWEEGQ